MPDISAFDVETFIAKLAGMGVRLSAVPLADGRLRVTRWCMIAASDHAGDIEALWKGNIGDDQARMDALAAHLVKTASRAGAAAAANA